MRKGVAALMVSVGFFACSDKAPQSGQGTSVLVPTPTPPTPGAGPTIFSFEGHYDAQTKKLEVAYAAPAGSGGIGTLGGTTTTLPYGQSADQVYFHTQSVLWQGACGTNTLCAPVVLRNLYLTPVTNVSAVFDAFTPSDVTATGAPYIYGTVGGGWTPTSGTKGESPPITWTFSDPTGANFQFIGRAIGTPPAPPGSATLSALPSPLTLPTLVVGTTQTSPSQVTITETSGASSTAALTVTRTTPGDAEIVAGTAGCNATALPAGGTCQNGYTLNCVGATATVKSAGFTVTDSASGNTAVYTVSGTCDPAPTGTAFLTMTPTSYDFGTVFLGAQGTASTDFTVANEGTGNTGTLSTPTQTSKVGDANFRFTGDCGSVTTVLSPGSTCSAGTVLDCRSPATPGTQSVNVTETDPTTGSNATIALTGSCACRPTGALCSASGTCCSGTCTGVPKKCL